MLHLSGTDRSLALEIDETDMTVLIAIRAGEPRDSRALATVTGYSSDQINLSLFKLLRLAVLKMDGEQWRLTERDFK